MLLELVIAAIFLLVCLNLTGWRRKAIAALLFASVVFIYLHPYLIYPFSPGKWSSASPFGKRMMARGFLNAYQVTGMTRTEVESILGQPDFGDYWSYNLEVTPLVRTHVGDAVVNPKLNISFSKNRVSRIDLPFPRDAVERSPFEAQTWKNASASHRARMVWDIEDRKLIAGLNSDQVRKLLGEPDSGIPATRISYDLGMYSLLGDPDPYGLEFRFNSAGRVESALVLQY